MIFICIWKSQRKYLSIFPNGKCFGEVLKGLCNAGIFMIVSASALEKWIMKTMEDFCHKTNLFQPPATSQLQKQVNVPLAQNAQSLWASMFSACFVPQSLAQPQHYNILPHSFEQLSQSSSVVRNRWGNERDFRNVNIISLFLLLFCFFSCVEAKLKKSWKRGEKNISVPIFWEKNIS